MPAWKNIVSQVGLRRDELVWEDLPAHDISSVRMLTAGMRGERGAYLYLVRRSELAKLQLDTELSLVVLDDTQEDAPLPEMYPCNCALVKGERIAAVVREVNWIFTVFAQIDQLLFRLQRCMTGGSGLQTMVDEVSMAFGFPADVLDNSFRFLATGGERRSALRQAYAQPGERLPLGILQEVRDSGQLRELVEATEPVLVERLHRDDAFSAWLTPISFNGIKLGYLAVLCPEAPYQNWFPQEYVGYLHIIANFFSLELNRVNFYAQNRGEVFSYVLSSLLETERADLEELRQRLKLGGYELEKNLYLMCVKPTGRMAGKRWSSHMAVHLRGLFSNSVYVERDGTLYYLISRGDSHLVSDYEQQVWREYLYTARLCGGLTGPFCDLDNVQARKTEAELALSVCVRKRRSLLRFQEAQIEALAEHLRREHTAELFCHRPTLALLRYDGEHDTQLVETLRRYLKNPKEPLTVCEELNIHKNTLYKRLDKIRDVMGEDFADADTILQFQLTLYLLDKLP